MILIISMIFFETCNFLFIQMRTTDNLQHRTSAQQPAKF
jgi:hypothetical protein